MPSLYIIAGPNGAGKTTSSSEILPELNVIEFVNADNIAKGISPYNSESVAIQAGRIMLRRIQELSMEFKDFAIETTLTTLSYHNLIKDCKAKGYNIVLFYVWLNSPELAKCRVKSRVEKGGHNIPEDVIERRYFKGMKNLTEIFIPLCDAWVNVDNSNNDRTIIAKYSNEEISVLDKEKYKIFFHD